MKKRFLSIFLTICMLLTLLPTGVSAADTCTCNVHCTAELIKETSCAFCLASGNPDDCKGTDTLEGGEFTYQGIVYKITDKYNHDVSVKDGTGVSGNVEIPRLAYNGDVSYTVTLIDYGAFQDCTGLSSVTIPGSVTEIRTSAFAGCTNLTSATIGNGVTSIGRGAFDGCTSLTNITIPNSVTNIAPNAFLGCTDLTSITILGSITSIGNSAFRGCTGLTSITIPDGVTSIGNNTFQDCTSLTSITIPGSVTSIGHSAFQGCTGLTSITIPSGVTSIGNSAFRGCTGLTSITIPDGVTSIGNNTFQDCTSLTSITIPGSITSIGINAFSGCTSLASITIPSSVTSIGDSAFQNCSNLANITIPDGVTSIGHGAFEDCDSLTNVTVPGSVSRIEDLAFSGCGNLSSVTLMEGVEYIEDSVFEFCPKLTSISIPDSVISIGQYAFQGCFALKSIALPDNLTSIGKGAFEDCDGLTSITIPASVTAIGQRAFRFCSSLETVLLMTDSPKTIDATAFEETSATITHKYVAPTNLRWDGTTLRWDALKTGYVRYKLVVSQTESPTGIVSKSETYYTTGNSYDLSGYLSNGTYEVKLTAVEPEILDNSQPSYESSDTITLELKYPHQVKISDIQTTRTGIDTASVSFNTNMAGTMYYRVTDMRHNTNPSISTDGEGTAVPQGYYEFDLSLVGGVEPTNPQYLYVTFKTADGVVSDVTRIDIDGYSGTTYKLTVTAGENGKIDPGSRYVEDGGSITFTITPDSGYKLDTLTLDGEDVTSAVADNQYTLSNVTAAHAIQVSFKSASCICETKCTDIANADCPECGADGADLSTVCNGPIKYNVRIYTTADGDGSDSISAEGGTISGEGSYAAGDTVTMTVSFNEGYCAVGWAAADSNIEPLERLYLEGIPTYASTDKTVTFTMPAQDVYITANFRTHDYAYSYRDNEDGTHTNVCKYCGIANGSASAHVDLTKEYGYEGANGYCDDCEARIPNKYILKFSSNHNEVEEHDYYQVVDVSNPSTTLPANNFTLEGHTFQGWATDSTATHAAYQPGDTYTVNADTTFYAIWNDNAHIHNHPTTWSGDKDGHWYECECGDRKDFAAHNPGDPATATTPQTCTVCGYEIAPATGYTLTINYAVTSSGITVGSGSETVTGITPGTVVDLSKYWPGSEATGSDGKTYYFVGFTKKGEIAVVNSVTVTSDIELEAAWTAEEQITVDLNPNGGALPYARTRENYGESIYWMNREHKPVRSGHDFVGWSLEDDGTADSGDTLITADCTLYAVWQQHRPSYDDDYYDPPPASIPVNVGGDYDAILRDNLIIVRGDAPISGTLDLGKTNAEAIRLPAAAVKASTGEGSSLTIRFPGGTAAALTGSGLVAAGDALRAGESLQISVTQVDAGTLPENLTAPPEDEEPFEDNAGITHYSVFTAEGIFTYDELSEFGVFGGADESISWGDMKLLYQHMTTEDLEILRNRFSGGSEDLVPFVGWLNEMLQRDTFVSPFNMQELMDIANLNDEQFEFLADMELNDPIIGELRQANLTLEQMQLLQSNAEELREGASAKEQAQYDALLSWLEDAIAQKELEQENATVTSMTLYGLEEYADLTDQQMKILRDMGLKNFDNPSVGQIKKLDLTLEQMELLYAEIDRARSTEYNPEYQAEYGVLLNWLEEAISEKEQDEQEADTTCINVGGQRAVFVGAIEADVKAVRAGGTARNLEILAGKSNAVAWSTNIDSAWLEEKIAEMKNATGTNVAVRAYKVLENGRLEAKATKVTLNADGTLTASALSNGNSTYIFVLEPNPYADVDENDWYYDAAMTMDQRLLMQGTTDTTFSPQEPMTRAMVWTILARMDGVDTSLGDTWDFVGTLWAINEYLTDGTEPAAPITREQLAAMLYRYAIFKGYDVSVGEDTNILSWPDVFDVSEYAFPAMQWACGAGIINGKDGLLAPDGSATRAETAAMLMRFLEYAER